MSADSERSDPPIPWQEGATDGVPSHLYVVLDPSVKVGLRMVGDGDFECYFVVTVCGDRVNLAAAEGWIRRASRALHELPVLRDEGPDS